MFLVLDSGHVKRGGPFAGHYGALDALGASKKAEVNLVELSEEIGRLKMQFDWYKKKYDLFNE